MNKNQSTVKSTQKDHFLKVLKLTESLFFFFALKTVSKVNFKSFNCGMAVVNTHGLQLPRDAVRQR